MSVKEQKKKQKEKVEDIRYDGTVPKEVLDEMTPEIITQYYLWDEVTKREIELYPWLILPLIREVFGRSYPKGVEIKLIATEYVEQEEVCLIRFADDSIHPYRVPVVKVQGYTPQMIEEKHLAMLIPFLPIRFRRYLGKKKSRLCGRAPEEVKKELTEFIQECILIIDR